MTVSAFVIWPLHQLGAADVNRSLGLSRSGWTAPCFGTNWIGRFSAGKRHLMLMVDFEGCDPTGILRPADAKVN